MAKPGVVARALALVGVLSLICQTTSARVPHRTAEGPHHHKISRGDADRLSLPDREQLAARSGLADWSGPAAWSQSPDWNQPTVWNAPRPMPVGFAFGPDIAPAFSRQPALTDAEWRVSEVAARNGDRDYLMVDKSRGRLIQFVNGVPVFISPALTGSSLADRIPREALSKSYAEQYDARFRVTPAGRFTVSHGFDHVVGATLDINEIKGRDWSIAIHSAGSASRDARLRSPYDADKHITEGCVNVDSNTMRRLALLPATHGRIPLYILPMDERLITQFF